MVRLGFVANSPESNAVPPDTSCLQDIDDFSAYDVPLPMRFLVYPTHRNTSSSGNHPGQVDPRRQCWFGRAREIEWADHSNTPFSPPCLEGELGMATNSEGEGIRVYHQTFDHRLVPKDKRKIWLGRNPLVDGWEDGFDSSGKRQTAPFIQPQPGTHENGSLSKTPKRTDTKRGLDPPVKKKRGPSGLECRPGCVSPRLWRWRRILIAQS